jgi:predicted O-methyltransferase YrrM
MLNYLHQLFYTIKNKLRREIRKKNSQIIPKQKNNFLNYKGDKIFDPIIFTPNFINDEIKMPLYNKEITKILNSQQDEPYVKFVRKFYKTISLKHKNHSNYVDMIKVLHVISKLIKPENYLEIGVRRGRSISIVAQNSPFCELYAFDMWIKNYTGVENPGPIIVKKELKKVKHKGKIHFFNGNSRKTIPEFKLKNPNVFFDLICVDGDHSFYGATVDLRNIIEMLKIGGYLIFDDTNSFEHPFLKNIWKNTFKNRDDFITKEFNELGLGVSIATRIY